MRRSACQGAGSRLQRRGAAGLDRVGAAGRGRLPGRPGPPASRRDRGADRAGTGTELDHRRGPGSPDHRRAVEGRRGMPGAVTERMLELLAAPRAAVLAEGPVTIDLDSTDVEIYGRKKREM